MSRFVKAIPGPKNSVIYIDESGERSQFSGGTRTWRNQNPGNLVPGGISRRNGQIGKASGFAVFPDYAIGHRALLDALKTTYGKASITVLVQGYAPKNENNTERYERFVRKETGVTNNKKIQDFSSAEFGKLWKAIEKMEGWKEGRVTSSKKKKKITRVRKDKKGTIIAYFIEQEGWTSKAQAISLVQSGEVDGVVCISSAGNPFIKSRPDSRIENNLSNLG